MRNQLVIIIILMSFGSGFSTMISSFAIPENYQIHTASFHNFESGQCIISDEGLQINPVQLRKGITAFSKYFNAYDFALINFSNVYPSKKLAATVAPPTTTHLINKFLRI